MESPVSPLEAQAALHAVEHGRRRVIDEIDMPRWYWWSVALGWIALGFITDLGHPWLTMAATLLFGVAHSTAAARVLSGRHRSGRMSVRADVAGREAPRFVITGLLVLA